MVRTLEATGKAAWLRRPDEATFFDFLLAHSVPAEERAGLLTDLVAAEAAYNDLVQRHGEPDGIGDSTDWCNETYALSRVMHARASLLADEGVAQDGIDRLSPGLGRYPPVSDKIADYYALTAVIRAYRNESDARIEECLGKGEETIRNEKVTSADRNKKLKKIQILREDIFARREAAFEPAAEPNVPELAEAAAEPAAEPDDTEVPTSEVDQPEDVPPASEPASPALPARSRSRSLSQSQSRGPSRSRSRSPAAADDDDASVGNATQDYAGNATRDYLVAELARFTREQRLPVDVSTWDILALRSLSRDARNLTRGGLSDLQVLHLEAFLKELLAVRADL